MDIECKQKREGGTAILMDAINYLFAPRSDGAHVAEVASEAHQDRFLAIPEGFRLYRGTAKAAAGLATPKVDSGAYSTSVPASLVKPNEDDIPLIGGDGFDASYTIGGTEFSIEVIIAMAHAKSKMDPDSWNALEIEDRSNRIETELDLLAEAAGDHADANGNADNAEERADLVQQFTAKFGKAPHHNLGVVKLRAALEAA